MPLTKAQEKRIRLNRSLAKLRRDWARLSAAERYHQRHYYRDRELALLEQIYNIDRDEFARERMFKPDAIKRLKGMTMPRSRTRFAIDDMTKPKDYWTAPGLDLVRVRPNSGLARSIRSTVEAGRKAEHFVTHARKHWNIRKPMAGDNIPEGRHGPVVDFVGRGPKGARFYDVKHPETRAIPGAALDRSTTIRSSAKQQKFVEENAGNVRYLLPRFGRARKRSQIDYVNVTEFDAEDFEDDGVSRIGELQLDEFYEANNPARPRRAQMRREMQAKYMMNPTCPNPAELDDRKPAARKDPPM